MLREDEVGEEDGEELIAGIQKILPLPLGTGVFRLYSAIIDPRLRNSGHPTEQVIFTPCRADHLASRQFPRFINMSSDKCPRGGIFMIGCDAPLPLIDDLMIQCMKI